MEKDGESTREEEAVKRCWHSPVDTSSYLYTQHIKISRLTVTLGDKQVTSDSHRRYVASCLPLFSLAIGPSSGRSSKSE